MSKQLDAWRGAFGDAYTDRNDVDWRSRVGAWREMLKDLTIGSVLEVGSNRGANLLALLELDRQRLLLGVEPNAYARAQARVPTVDGSAANLPFGHRTFDLVLTAGVLIHIAPEELNAALQEIYRVARRYILAIEYYAEQETIVRNYHGQDDMLWKRPFDREYLHRFPYLHVLRSGWWTRDHGFDNCAWWLMENNR